MDDVIIPTPIDTALAHAQAIEITRAQQQATVVDILNEKFTEVLVNIKGLQVTQEDTNEHLRILNGKVAKHKESLTTLMLWKAEARGFGIAVNAGWVSVWAVVGALLSGLGVYWLYKK